MFEKGLLKALESEHRAGGVIPEVKVVANGHCHSKHHHGPKIPSSDFLVSHGGLQANPRRVVVLWRRRVSLVVLLLSFHGINRSFCSSYSGYSKVG
jgi:hypothetical protein